MKRLRLYLKTALKNIMTNKPYAFFVIIGTAFTFIFITILIQLSYSIINDTVPLLNGERSILIDQYMDDRGKRLPGILPSDIEMFTDGIPGMEAYSKSNSEYGSVVINNVVENSYVAFVNPGYWQINQFSFLQGRSFTEQEYMKSEPVAIVKKQVALKFFKDKDIIGQFLEFQNRQYKIIGVIDDFSYFSSNILETIWLSDKFNTFTPSSKNYYNLCVMFNKGYPMILAKEQLSDRITAYYYNIGHAVNLSNLRTVREMMIARIGGTTISLGLPLIILLLLLIPALNIITLSYANTNNRSKELAIERVFGATITNVFVQIIIESLILVLVGVFIGVVLSVSFVHVLGNILLSNNMLDISLMPQLNIFVVLLIIIPISLLFTIMSNGLPAYAIAKSNISATLKK